MIAIVTSSAREALNQCVRCGVWFWKQADAKNRTTITAKRAEIGIDSFGRPSIFAVKPLQAPFEWVGGLPGLRTKQLAVDTYPPVGQRVLPFKY